MKEYVLKSDWPPLSPTIKRLQQFYDWQLSIEGELYKALMKEGIQYGHGNVAEQGSGSISGGDREGSDEDEASR